MNNNYFDMIAKTMMGLEEVLADELVNIGAINVNILSRAVSFKGDNNIMYRANLWCRTALRVLKIIKVFDAKNESELYDEVSRIDWQQWMNTHDTIAVDCTLNSSNFSNSVFVSQRTKDAIVDQFRHKTGQRPSVNLDNPAIRLNIHVSGDSCTLSVDSSGKSLHKRGYRKFTPPAPINEVLAAGLIKLSGWDLHSNFIDPMCGSGTILTEAALMALNIPPGYYQKKFAFENLPDFNSQLWNNIKNEIPSSIGEFDGEIIGSDISKDAVDMAHENIKTAGLHKDIKIVNKSILEFEPPPGPGVVITNPPYGERIGINNISDLYRSMGNAFKKFYNGYNVWVISSDIDTIKLIGLHPSKKIKLFNGPLECRFIKFSIYEGSKKNM
jgi:putative N6-adenine-specific DNA methylase